MADPRLTDLAARIADGTPIDWDGLPLEMPGVPQDVAAGARLVQRLAQVHASLPSEDSFSASLFPPLIGSLTDTGVALDPITWGPLTIQERLGQGTFGEVYRALDRRLNRAVALKLLRHKDRRESAVIDEGHRLACIRHPNVVTVYGAERIDGRVGLWMEFVDGKTLDQELHERKRFDPAEVQSIGADLAAALGAVHRAGLLHRDVKAQNVMRDADGRVLLMDFGAGQDYSRSRDRETAALAGTPLYLAPEVLDGRAPSPASDIYSLGVLLFYLATGTFPVEGRSLEELRAAHRQVRTTSPRSREARLPARLTGAIERALDPDPTRRFATALELERALRPHAPGRWRPLWAAVLTIVVVAIAGVLTRSWWLPVGPDPGRHLTHLTPDLQAKFAFRGAAIDGRWMPCSPRGQQAVAICDLATGSVEVLRNAVRGPKGQMLEMSPAVPAFLSPDRKTLAYFWEVTDLETRATSRTLRAVDVNGRNDRPLYAITGSSSSVVIGKWMPDVRHLFIRETFSGAVRDLLIPVDGSAPVVIGGRTPADFESDLSPDLQTLVVSRRVAPDHRDLVAIDVASGAVRWQLYDPADETFPKWTPDGRGLVFVSDRAGGEHLMFVSVTSEGVGRPEVLRPAGRARLELLAFGSADAIYLKFHEPASTAYIADADLDRGVVEQERPLDPRTIEDSMGADWSPDGARFAYLRGRSNRPTSPPMIVIRERDGRIVREIPVGGTVLPDGSLVQWSPDRRRLAVLTGDGKQARLTVVDLEGGNSQLLAADANLSHPRWDGTSTALYYYTRRLGEAGQPGPWEIMRRGLSSEPEHIYRPSDKVTLYRLGGLDPVPESGAIALFVVPHGAPDTTMIRVVTGEEHRDFPVDQNRCDCTALAWIGSGPKLILSKVIKPGQSGIWLLDTTSGTHRLLRTTPPRIRDLSIRPDGKQIMFTAGNPRGDIWVFSGLSSMR